MRTCARTGIVVLLTVVGGVATSGSALSADQAIVTEWLRDRALPEVKKLSDKFRGDFTIETRGQGTTTEGGKTYKMTSHNFVRKTGRMYLIGSEETGGRSNVLQRVQGLNSKYFFELKRNKAGTAWLLSRVLENAPGTEFEQDRGVAELRSSIDGMTTMLTNLVLPHGIVPVDQVTSLPGFILKSATLSGPNDQVLAIAFEYDHKDPESGKLCRPACTAEFDLGMYGIPKRYTEAVKTTTRETVRDNSHELIVTTDGIELRNKTSTRVVAGGQTTYASDNEATAVTRFTRSPEPEFTLTAFGLPEPPGIEWGRSTPWYAWLAVAGVGCLAVFLVLRRVAARRT